MGASGIPRQRCFSKLFPTTSSFLIFISYMSLSVSLGILVTKTQDKDNGYSYNVTTIVLLVELLKLAAAVGAYFRSGTVSHLIRDIQVHRKVLALYLVPGGLYCLSNNLVFTSLSNFDPTTYMLLLQLRVLVTGLVYQMVFKKNLSRVQWFSLFVLTVGCMVKQLDVQPKTMGVERPSEQDLALPITADGRRNNLQIDQFDEGRKLLASIGHAEESEAERSLKMTTNQAAPLPVALMVILVQVLCSCFAGVYNERLLKDYSPDMGIVLHSIFMYVDSSLSNLVLLVLKGELTSAFSSRALLQIARSPAVLLVALNSAVLGLITSVFLKNLNSILKVFASAIEPVLLALLCWVTFGYEVTMYTLLSITLVAGASLVYALYPLHVAPTSTGGSNLKPGSSL